MKHKGQEEGQWGWYIVKCVGSDYKMESRAGDHMWLCKPQKGISINSK